MYRTALSALGLALLASSAAIAAPLNALESKCAAEAASTFETGFGTIGRPAVEIDTQRALDVCQAALGTGQNDFHLNAWIARTYYAAGQYGDALYFAERAAQNDIPLGLYLTGVLYSQGEGTGGAEQGVDLLTASAETGFVPAYHALAVNLINGTGIDADPEFAVGLLQFAADEGYGPAATTLGYMHLDGIGVIQDDAEANRLMRLAAHLEDAEGLHASAWFAEQGIGGPVDAAQAVELYWSAIEHGSVQSMLNLAGLYIEGVGVSQDLDMASELISRAANLGNKDAIKVLDMIANS